MRQAVVELAQCRLAVCDLPSLLHNQRPQLLGDVVAATGRAHRGQLTGRVQRQIQLPQAQEEPQPFLIFWAVVAVARGRASRGWQQTARLIEAHRLSRGSYSGSLITNPREGHLKPCARYKVKLASN
jgi:hypothetical protein